MVRGSMQRDQSFAFFEFKALTASRLLRTHGKGTLANWVPASGHGTVRRSSNIYFALSGLTRAYHRARGLCEENR